MVFPQQVSFKEILQAALLVLWIGLGVQQRGAEDATRHQGRFIPRTHSRINSPISFYNPPLQSLVNKYFSQTFELLFLKKNPEKLSPHLNLGSSLGFFELFHGVVPRVLFQIPFLRFFVSSLHFFGLHTMQGISDKLRELTH